MKKNTIKKVLPMLAGALVIALVISILPSGYFSEASRNPNTKLVEEKHITLEQAERIALNKVNDKSAKIVEFEVELTVNNPKYKFEIDTEAFEYEIEINAITGEIIDYEKDSHDDYRDYDDDKGDKDDDEKVLRDKEVTNKPVVDTKYITKEKAIEIALARIGSKATLDEIEFEKDDNPPKYEIEMYDDKYEYEIEIHAITGDIIDYEKDSHDDHDDYKDDDDDYKTNNPVMNVRYITKEKAIEIALARIGSKAVLDEIEFEQDDNPPKYEIEMYDDKYEYEIEIHAITGAVLEFERDED